MADEKQYLSRIRLIDGTTVNIKDQEARAELKTLTEGQETNKEDILTLLEQIQWGEF